MSKSERNASELARSEFDRDLGLPHTEQVRATVHDPAGKLRTLRLDGAADHRDICLSEQDRARGDFTPCVSRARSQRLVLDL